MLCSQTGWCAVRGGTDAGASRSAQSCEHSELRCSFSPQTAGSPTALVVPNGLGTSLLSQPVMVISTTFVFARLSPEALPSCEAFFAGLWAFGQAEPRRDPHGLPRPENPAPPPHRPRLDLALILALSCCSLLALARAWSSSTPSSRRTARSLTSSPSCRCSSWGTSAGFSAVSCLGAPNSRPARLPARSM